MILVPGLEPHGPLLLRWAGAGDPLGCRYCDDGCTPVENHIQLSDRQPGLQSELHICPECAHRADPVTSRVTGYLEGAWQELLGFHEQSGAARGAADVLREMADELDRLDSGARRLKRLDVVVTDEGVATVYTTTSADRT